MSATAYQPVDTTALGVKRYADILRDTRHLDARAAPDLADWLAYLEVEGKADRTLYAYMRLLARLLVAYPEHELRDFTDTDIERFLAGIPRPSRHVPRSIVGKFFEWAKKKKRISENPMESVAKVRPPHHRPRDIFTPAEVAALEAGEDGPLFALLFGSGLRRSEAIHLRLEHVDLDRQRLIVLAGKGAKDRLVPILPTAAIAVNDLVLLEGLNRADHLWYAIRGRGIIDRRDPIGDSTFANWYSRRLKQAGVRYLSPHTTRHTYGHILRELGFDLEERQLLMGHESVRTTQKYYGHLTVEDVAAKMRALT
jgi:integrase/recombinase XerD